jgi:membrane protein implicated in regulation of membrane protease activity
LLRLLLSRPLSFTLLADLLKLCRALSISLLRFGRTTILLGLLRLFLLLLLLFLFLLSLSAVALRIRLDGQTKQEGSGKKRRNTQLFNVI